MNKSLQKALQLLGLSPKESQFYELLLERGPQTANQLARLSNTKRSTAYLLVDTLLNKKLLTKETTSYKHLLLPVSPDHILSKIKHQRIKLKQTYLSLAKALPDLESTYSASKFKPKIRVYQGENGLRTVWQDILTAKKETLIITNQQAEQKVFTRRQHDNFIEDRISHKIFARVLALHNLEGEKLKAGDPIFYRQTKLFNSDNFTAETYIYNDKIAILDCDQDIIGIIIQSPTIVKTYQSIFHSLWQIS